MNITTLANIGDTVYIMEKNKIAESCVEEISIYIKSGNKDLQIVDVLITYTIESRVKEFQESEVFLTKQALLDSL